MAKEIMFTATQIAGTTGSLTAARPREPQPPPAVQASAKPGSQAAKIGILAIIAWLVLMRIAWHYGARI